MPELNTGKNLQNKHGKIVPSWVEVVARKTIHICIQIILNLYWNIYLVNLSKNTQTENKNLFECFMILIQSWLPKSNLRFPATAENTKLS
jgi:hypothetical protein